jgi:hypothetical protein
MRRVCATARSWGSSPTDRLRRKSVAIVQGTRRRQLGGPVVVALVTMGLLLSASTAQATNPGVIGRIAYAGPGTLHVMNADGTGSVDITPATCADAYEPRWAPGGAKIAFINRCGPSGSFDISTIDPAGTGFAAVVANSVDEARVTFSPDGTKIAYMSAISGNPDIYVADANGTNPVRLTDAPGSDDSPSWSPDGSKIVFDSDRAGGARDIYAMNADGSNVVRLTYGSGGALPNWSPDGGRIAFTRDGNIFWMRADGSGLRQLTTGGGDSPDWSPDGTKIAYDVNRSAVVVANADGTSPHVVASGIQPAWEPVAGNGNPSLWFSTPPEAGVGEPLSLDGPLTIPGGVAAGKSLQVFATPPGGSRSQIGSATTTTDGSFAFSTTPSVIGTWVYEVDWAGDAGHAAAGFTETVAVGKRVASLRLTTSRSVVKFGKNVRLTVQVMAGPARSDVLIFRQRAGGPRALVKRGAVNATGILSMVVTPGSTTSYFATYAGDATWGAAESQHVTVSVKGVWRAKALHGYATAGRYRLYHYTTACANSAPDRCPLQSFQLLPVHPQFACVFTFQYYHGGRWLTESHTWTLDAHSQLYTYTAYTSRKVIGIRYRARATFPGDGSAGRASSVWVYWMVTR